jgi:hypothetical protein
MKSKKHEFSNSITNHMKEDCFYEIVDDNRIDSQFDVRVLPIPNTQYSYRALPTVVINSLSIPKQNEYFVKISYSQTGFFTKDNPKSIPTSEVKEMLQNVVDELKTYDYEIVSWYAWSQHSSGEFDSRIIIGRGSDFSKLEFDKYCSIIHVLFKITI